jgi:hypothetical protein
MNSPSRIVVRHVYNSVVVLETCERESTRCYLNFPIRYIFLAPSLDSEICIAHHVATLLLRAKMISNFNPFITGTDSRSNTYGHDSLVRHAPETRCQFIGASDQTKKTKAKGYPRAAPTYLEIPRYVYISSDRLNRLRQFPCCRASSTDSRQRMIIVPTAFIRAASPMLAPLTKAIHQHIRSILQ